MIPHLITFVQIAKTIHSMSALHKGGHAVVHVILTNHDGHNDMCENIHSSLYVNQLSGGEHLIIIGL